MGKNLFHPQEPKNVAAMEIKKLYNDVLSLEAYFETGRKRANELRRQLEEQLVDYNDDKPALSPKQLADLTAAREKTIIRQQQKNRR